MKAFLARFGRLRHPIPVLCYTLTLAGWLLWSFFCLGSDLLGGVEPIPLGPGDFVVSGLEPAAETEGWVYQTVSGDPQMILEDVSGLPVRNLVINAAYTKDAREMCLYYTTRPGEAFSQDKRVFAVQDDSGACTYTLPRKRICSLRLDPCSPAENEMLQMTVFSVTLNAPQPWWQYFAPGWKGFFDLVLRPGMAAALLSLLQGLWRTRPRRKKA